MADESTRREVEKAAAAAEDAAAAARDAADAARKAQERGQPDGDGTGENDQHGENSQRYAPTRGTDGETQYGTGEGDL